MKTFTNFLESKKNEFRFLFWSNQEPEFDIMIGNKRYKYRWKKKFWPHSDGVRKVERRYYVSQSIGIALKELLKFAEAIPELQKKKTKSTKSQAVCSQCKYSMPPENVGTKCPNCEEETLELLS